MSIRYSVFTTLKDVETLDEYVTWLKDVHVKDVIKAGGALSAEVIIKGDFHTFLYCLTLATVVPVVIYI